LAIKIIDIAVNLDHVHLFMRYQPKHYILEVIIIKSNRMLRDEFPQLKN